MWERRQGRLDITEDEAMRMLPHSSLYSCPAVACSTLVSG